MKYFSDKTQKVYDDVAALEVAEKKFDEEHAAEIAKKEERAADAKHVEELYKKANDAMKEANEALNDFCSKYGSFHTTIKNVPNSKTLFDYFFNTWLF